MLNLYKIMLNVNFPIMSNAAFIFVQCRFNICSHLNTCILGFSVVYSPYEKHTHIEGAPRRALVQAWPLLDAGIFASRK